VRHYTIRRENVHGVFTTAHAISQNTPRVFRIVLLRRMKFRSKRRLASCWAASDALVAGGLYLGWLSLGRVVLQGPRALPHEVGVFDVFGPVAWTFVIANPGKPRRKLGRVIGIHRVLQIIAAGTAPSTLWKTAGCSTTSFRRDSWKSCRPSDLGSRAGRRRGKIDRSLLHTGQLPR